MPFDVDALLPLAECVKPRAPKELREWVLAKCDAFRQIPELREPVLRHEGPFKWFHEEIYPLSVFAVRRYGDRDDVLCVKKGGDRKSTRLNSSHVRISYAVFCLKKKNYSHTAG